MECENCKIKNKLLEEIISNLFMPKHKDIVFKINIEINKPPNVLIRNNI